ncbi:DNA polymerase [Gemmata sp.]|uniref:DNA polymerase n=1 Tax=Gemmata sp. TaxID=1914242 RepID=UPI003F724A96
MDFEFRAPDGHRPEPLCVVARGLRSGRLVRVWLTDHPPPMPQYSAGPDELFVAYYASAELGCHLALNWPLPVRVLDLFTEFRNLTNGCPAPHGNGLLGALAYFGLDALDAAEKDAMRSLAMRGGEYADTERNALLDYCQSDVDSLTWLLPRMVPHLDLPRALLRGRYMAAVARMEANGVPIDVPTLRSLGANWDRIKCRLVQEIDRDYNVFVPTGRRPDPASRSGAAVLDTEMVGSRGRVPFDSPVTFSAERWAAYLSRTRIPWPRLPSGALALDDETFRELAKSYPAQVGPMRELRHTLGQMRLNDLAVGSDGRNRTLLSVFRSRTGRNQPSNSRFVFGPSAWLRSLIRPEPGRALAYVDWSQQELAIAAALSRDPKMMEAYTSGDFYLTFARLAGAVPPSATKKTHGQERDQFKTVALGVLYGLSADGLARKLGVPVRRGRELLGLHQRTFRRFWEWSDAIEERAILTGELSTVFGWTVRVGANVNPRSLRNFPMQGNGAEMMRLAACLATESGITVCCPVHDAFLIEASTEDIDAETARMQDAMQRASEWVLPGFPLKTEAKIVRHPDRYSDPRGERMWAVVQRILADLEPAGLCHL